MHLTGVRIVTSTLQPFVLAPPQADARCVLHILWSDLDDESLVLLRGGSTMQRNLDGMKPQFDRLPIKMFYPPSHLSSSNRKRGCNGKVWMLPPCWSVTDMAT
ncbi:hypothetical protein B0H66DRAFT_566805 [Apodospora peruviana]|uniref:Uncharacterized protein n=1 Tax=Apodospora peruviana TaxID=516989 RepID=A0AAE0HVX0_9PEZI|nr:hypothetical protein B0H66DRAFT_566805 [Apodospora peruviana]